jgi:hypothetical protein
MPNFLQAAFAILRLNKTRDWGKKKNFPFPLIADDPIIRKFPKINYQKLDGGVYQLIENIG